MFSLIIERTVLLCPQKSTDFHTPASIESFISLDFVVTMRNIGLEDAFNISANHICTIRVPTQGGTNQPPGAVPPERPNGTNQPQSADDNDFVGMAKFRKTITQRLFERL